MEEWVADGSWQACRLLVAARNRRRIFSQAIADREIVTKAITIHLIHTLRHHRRTHHYPRQRWWRVRADRVLNSGAQSWAATANRGATCSIPYRLARVRRYDEHPVPIDQCAPYPRQLQDQP